MIQSIYDHPQLVFAQRESARLQRLHEARDLHNGDRVIASVDGRHHRWGRIDHVTSTGYVLVQMWSDSLGRFVYGTTSYHPRFIRKWVG